MLSAEKSHEFKSLVANSSGSDLVSRDLRSRPTASEGSELKGRLSDTPSRMRFALATSQCPSAFESAEQEVSASNGCSTEPKTDPTGSSQESSLEQAANASLGSIEPSEINNGFSGTSAVPRRSHSFLGQFAALCPVWRQRAHMWMPRSHLLFFTALEQLLMLKS